MLEAGAVEPCIRGRRGRYTPSWFSLMQAVGIAYAQAFINARCHRSWAYEACEWVAAQDPESLIKEFEKGNTLLCLAPITSQTRLVPLNKPDATRELRIRLAQLNLEIVYKRVLRRAGELEAVGLPLRAGAPRHQAEAEAPQAAADADAAAAPGAEAEGAPKDAEGAGAKKATPKERDRKVGKPVNRLPRRSVKAHKSGPKE
jgi:hypothetical protein